MITFDAEKFMSALDAYIESFTMESVHSSKAQLQEQLKVLEDAIKTTDRLLLAQVEIAGLVKSANEFITQKETMPVAALGCVVRALSVLADLGEEAESSDESQTRAPAPSTLSAQETSMPKILRQKDVLALKTLLQRARFERAEFGQLHPDPGDPLPKTEAEVTDFIKRRTRLYIESWVAPIITALIARGEGLDDPDGENALDHASRP